MQRRRRDLLGSSVLMGSEVENGGNSSVVAERGKEGGIEGEREKEGKQEEKKREEKEGRKRERRLMDSSTWVFRSLLVNRGRICLILGEMQPQTGQNQKKMTKVWSRHAPCNETEGLTSNRWHCMRHTREKFMARGTR